VFVKVWDEAPIKPVANDPIDMLLTKIMTSTHICPQSYKINRIRYHPVPIVEGDFGKVHKGRDLNVCVSMVARPGDVSVRFAYSMSRGQR
jgi:hypothetical protein